MQCIKAVFFSLLFICLAAYPQQTDGSSPQSGQGYSREQLDASLVDSALVKIQQNDLPGALSLLTDVVSRCPSDYRFRETQQIKKN